MAGEEFDIDAFLSQPLTARIATNGPTVRPTWFLWEDQAFAFAQVRSERYLERLPWRMHGRYAHGRTGLCHMCDASTMSASRSQISTS